MKKARAFKTKILSFSKWKSQGWIEVNRNNEKLYVEPSPLESHQKSYYNIEQLRCRYDKYVVDSLYRQKVELMYELQQRGYECTTNSWYEIDSLGVTIHPDTDGIWSESYYAKNANAARFMFSRYYDIPYDEVKARREPCQDLWILKNNPYSNVLHSEHIRLMLSATGNTLGKTFNGYRNRYQSDFSEFWESMIRIGIADKAFSNDLNFYYLNDVGIAIVQLMLPTKNRHIHIRNLEIIMKSKLLDT